MELSGKTSPHHSPKWDTFGDTKTEKALAEFLQGLFPRRRRLRSRSELGSRQERRRHPLGPPLLPQGERDGHFSDTARVEKVRIFRWEVMNAIPS